MPATFFFLSLETIVRVGFIGPGIMGRPMVLNLLRGGYEVDVFARRPEALGPLLDAGCRGAESPADLAGRCDIVLSCVADAADVEQVALGPGGLAESGRQGLVYVDLSTISPVAARDIAAGLARRGIRMLDAPVSGGEAGAMAGTLTVFVGGDAQAFETAQPVLACLGKTVTRIGESGAGQLAKACNQVITGSAIVAVAEALSFARACGADPARVRQVLLGGFATSRILDVHGGRMLARDFAPGFKSWMHQKDMAIVLREARAAGVALPLAASAWQFFNRMVGEGLGEEDSVAVLKLYEQAHGVFGGEAPGSSTPPSAGEPDGAAHPPLGAGAGVGFIGLGVMGRPMALNLLRAGHRVAVYARRAAAAAPLAEAGARVLSSPAEVARECEVVFTAVTGSADVEEVLIGAAGVVDCARPGLIVVDHSTIAPRVAQHLAQRLADAGVTLLDAPVSGGAQGAIDATLAIMVGGDGGALERVRPLLDCLGRTVIHIGPSGSGQIAKACNQMVMVAAIQACAEAMLLAGTGGADRAAVLAGLMGGSAQSRVLQVMGARMVARDFAAGIEARLHHKDFGLIEDEAHLRGLWLPVAAVVAQQLNALMGHGWARHDTSSLLQVLEAQAGVTAG